ncbi:hypothetical protein DUF29 [Janthinobacterium sp. HH01]|uniref:DUF29 domain-containing protein n=1 Tax=Janthinobacterium sp. HH01 TaxID=1198452 RepID=UPI0002AE83FA|nr:DUF29 domain-containing protein [Janthinobacterium sp. HH01]ELX10373.1 hypothetical protein DUF29 [Janthinobacterium sp. HH01]
MDDHIDSDYERDFLVWTEAQVALLRARKFEQLDLENVIEELEAVARRDKREVAHRTEKLLTHLLKCRVQPERISNSWRRTICEQRKQIARLLKDAPSLARTVDDYLDESYTAAAARAADETGLPPATFPPANPFSKQQVFDPDFLP